jgi:hypothetical protein
MYYIYANNYIRETSISFQTKEIEDKNAYEAYAGLATIVKDENEL